MKGVASKDHKEGSVNKLLMLIATPNVQELYPNMKILLNELNLVSVGDFSITSDIKMGEFFLSKQ